MTSGNTDHQDGLETYTTLNDMGLVELCQAELPYNTQGFEALMRRHEPWVYNTCVRSLGHEADARDASQDVFMKVFHALRGFERRSAFKTWLYRIIANVCSEYHSKRKRTAVSLQSLAEHLLTLEPSGPSNLEGFSETTMGDALSRLKEDDAEIVLLRHVLGLSFDELADAMDLKVSAAKMRLYRAEERLKASFLNISKQRGRTAPDQNN